jgi:hypothetical protein
MRSLHMAHNVRTAGGSLGSPAPEPGARSRTHSPVLPTLQIHMRHVSYAFASNSSAPVAESGGATRNQPSPDDLEVGLRS